MRGAHCETRGPFALFLAFHIYERRQKDVGLKALLKAFVLPGCGSLHLHNSRMSFRRTSGGEPGGNGGRCGLVKFRTFSENTRFRA